MANPTFTPVSESGRYKLIRRIHEQINNSQQEVPGIVRGIGDDCAVFRSSADNEFHLVSSETYMEGVDFDLTYMPLQHLGYKLVSAAISDIYAMNGTPAGILVNLAIPNKISTEMVELIYEGINRACQVYGTAVVGGDITASTSGLTIGLTVTGNVSSDRITYRSGAEMNDAVCVTGDFGGAYAGLKVLLREKRIWNDTQSEEAFQPNLDEYEYVVRRQLVPQSRNDLIKTLAEQDIVPGAMIDISKNLLQDLMQLALASNKGVKIYEAAIPIALETRAVADEFEDDVVQYALQGGEDYELLFTLPEDKVNKLTEHFRDFVVIGKVIPASKGIQMQASSGDIIHFDTKQME